MKLFGAIPHDNAPRFREAGAHVESWFWRLNHPSERRAVWIKATVFKPVAGEATADVWCIHFDGSTVTGRRKTVPLSEASFSSHAQPLSVEIAGARFTLDDQGGQLKGAVAELAWDIEFTTSGGAVAEPLCIFPNRRLLVAPVPRSKLVTPLPTITATGVLRCGDTQWDLSGWIGSQGHNWGPEHTEQYVWSQCVFPGTDGPAVMVEGVSARIRLGRWLTPWLSALVVRRGDQVWRFDRMVDVWNHKTAIHDMSWALHIKGPAGEATLKVSADPDEMACLGYHNPDGRLSYCMNSKLSRVTLRVNPRKDDAFECHSEHGGALEFLRGEPDERLGEVI